jgi:hypothetical protein
MLSFIIGGEEEKRGPGGLGDLRGWRGLVWSAEVGGLPSARSHLADGKTWSARTVHLVRVAVHISYHCI